MKVTVPTKTLYTSIGILDTGVVLVTVWSVFFYNMMNCMECCESQKSCPGLYSHQEYLSIQSMQGFSGHLNFHPKSLIIATFGKWLFDYIASTISSLQVQCVPDVYTNIRCNTGAFYSFVENNFHCTYTFTIRAIAGLWGHLYNFNSGVV